MKTDKKHIMTIDVEGIELKDGKGKIEFSNFQPTGKGLDALYEDIKHLKQSNFDRLWLLLDDFRREGEKAHTQEEITRSQEWPLKYVRKARRLLIEIAGQAG